MEFKEFKATSVDDAITNASLSLGVPSTELVYEVVEEGSNGFLFGIGKKNAVIRVRVKTEEENENPSSEDAQIDKTEPVKEEKPKFKMEVKKDQVHVDTFTNKTEVNENTVSVKSESKTEKAESEEIVSKQEEIPAKKERVITNPENIDEILDGTKKFLDELFAAMKIETKVDISFDKEKNDINVELSGEEMGVLIGKRGNTLDSLQYLTSLYCNKLSDVYLRVKMDTENYRARRKQTLEHLAKNIAFKVKKTRRPVYLEPMNPYERRIIHSALQNDRYVTTRSEGEEPYRKVVVVLKK